MSFGALINECIRTLLGLAAVLVLDVLDIIETLSGREDRGAPVSVSVPCVVCLPCFCSFHCFVAGRRIDRITDWDGVKTREGCVE